MPKFEGIELYFTFLKHGHILLNVANQIDELNLVSCYMQGGYNVKDEIQLMLWPLNKIG